MKTINVILLFIVLGAAADAQFHIKKRPAEVKHTRFKTLDLRSYPSIALQFLDKPFTVNERRSNRKI